MDVFRYVRRLNARPLGRIGISTAGLLALYGALAVAPTLRTVLWWGYPALFLFWGGSRLYQHGVDRPLTAVAGCLLVLGGVTRALFQLSPMSELAGTVANLVPLLGVFAEMYATHYREHD